MISRMCRSLPSLLESGLRPHPASLQDLGDDAGADGLAALADGKA
jgi:hypothetical protein